MGSSLLPCMLLSVPIGFAGLASAKVRVTGMVALSLLCLALSCPAQDAARSVGDRLRALASKYPSRVQIATIGKSRGARPILAACLGHGADAKGVKGLMARRAALLVAGLDGRRVEDVELALLQIETAAAATDDSPLGKILRDTTLVVLPLANPDAYALGHREATLGAEDSDRDGKDGEDPADDWNGDGQILKMRRKDPRGTFVLDSDHPEGIRKARPGESGTRYTLVREGKDDDADGRFNEDERGGVRLQRNFPYLYPEHEAGAGSYALSEPSALALAEFVLSNPRFAFVLFYGSRDNLLEKPATSDAKERKEPGGYLEDDAWIFEDIGKSYRKITGREGKNTKDWEGSFPAWVYFHAGIPIFSTSLIDRVAKKKSEETPKEAGAAGSTPKTSKDPEEEARVRKLA